MEAKFIIFYLFHRKHDKLIHTNENFNEKKDVFYMNKRISLPELVCEMRMDRKKAAATLQQTSRYIITMIGADTDCTIHNSSPT